MPTVSFSCFHEKVQAGIFNDSGAFVLKVVGLELPARPSAAVETARAAQEGAGSAVTTASSAPGQRDRSELGCLCFATKGLQARSQRLRSDLPASSEADGAHVRCRNTQPPLQTGELL